MIIPVLAARAAPKSALSPTMTVASGIRSSWRAASSGSRVRFALCRGIAADNRAKEAIKAEMIQHQPGCFLPLVGTDADSIPRIAERRQQIGNTIIERRVDDRFFLIDITEMRDSFQSPVRDR